jgi:hypothetical protein
MSKHVVRRQPYTLPALQEEEGIVTKEFKERRIKQNEKL